MKAVVVEPLLGRSNLRRDSLKGEVTVVTGAGRGIGFEAARALLWLGSKVVLAEVDDTSGREAAAALEEQFGKGSVVYVKTDVGKDEDVTRLARGVLGMWGRVDAVVNNATVFPMGEVKDTPIGAWDLSYRVNLRGPALLARAFLPGMVHRKHGVFVCVSSSGAAPFMGPYEVFKTAQGELASTIAAEVEGTGVYAFTIGPGIVKTPGFLEGGAKVASFMGKTLDELLEMNRNFEISSEEAGVGFAASVVLASKYHGQETSSIQVLRDIGLVAGGENKEGPSTSGQAPAESDSESTVVELYGRVLNTYIEQSDGWKKRNLFERQWVARDFKKSAAMSIDEMLTAVKGIGNSLENPAHMENSMVTLKKLASYYRHQQEQLRGFEKDPEKLRANLQTIEAWIEDVERLTKALAG